LVKKTEGILGVKDYNVLSLDLEASYIFYKDYVQSIYNCMFYYIYIFRALLYELKNGSFFICWMKNYGFMSESTLYPMYFLPKQNIDFVLFEGKNLIMIFRLYTHVFFWSILTLGQSGA
jgi:hypothetical protein